MIARKKERRQTATADHASATCKNLTSRLPSEAGAVKPFSHCAFARALVAFPWPKRKRLGCVAVGTALAAHAGIGTGDQCWPSTKTLARESGVSRPTVILARQALREAGFLSWIRAEEGRAHGFRYQLTVPDLPDSRGQVKTPRHSVAVKLNHRSRSNGSTETGTRERGQRTEEEGPPPLVVAEKDGNGEVEPELLELAKRLQQQQGFQCAPRLLGKQIQERVALGLSLAEIEAELRRAQWRGREPWPALDALRKRARDRKHEARHIITVEVVASQYARLIRSLGDDAPALFGGEDEKIAGRLRAARISLDQLHAAISGLIAKRRAINGSFSSSLFASLDLPAECDGKPASNPDEVSAICRETLGPPDDSSKVADLSRICEGDELSNKDCLHQEATAGYKSVKRRRTKKHKGEATLAKVLARLSPERQRRIVDQAVRMAELELLEQQGRTPICRPRTRSKAPVCSKLPEVKPPKMHRYIDKRGVEIAVPQVQEHEQEGEPRERQPAPKPYPLPIREKVLPRASGVRGQAKQSQARKDAGGQGWGA